MSLEFAAITPHPPIIIPEIGKDNIAHARATIIAMEKLEQKFYHADIDSVIIISPHAEARSFAMTVFTPKQYGGDFSGFNAPEIKMQFPANNILAEKIEIESCNAEIPTEVEVGQFPLDHGAMVPLYYLTKNVSREIKLIEIAFSALSRVNHAEFGRIIGEIVGKGINRTAIIASGDMSHRIFDEQYSEYGKKFDQEVAGLIKNNRLSEIINIDEDLVDLAGECGYRSLLILAGALSDKQYKAEILSYEAPFGVGYLVANFELN